MKLEIYTVRDNVSEAFLQPFFSVNRGSAIRSLIEVCNDPQHTFHKHAADYTLYYVGSFDDATGLLDAQDNTTRVVNLSELIKEKIIPLS